MKTSTKPGSTETTKAPSKQPTADIQELLNKLAIARGDNVRKRLIGQYKIAVGRIFDCQPEVSDDETSKPEVSLGL